MSLERTQKLRRGGSSGSLVLTVQNDAPSSEGLRKIVKRGNITCFGPEIAETKKEMPKKECRRRHRSAIPLPKENTVKLSDESVSPAKEPAETAGVERSLEPRSRIRTNNTQLNMMDDPARTLRDLTRHISHLPPPQVDAVMISQLPSNETACRWSHTAGHTGSGIVSRSLSQPAISSGSSISPFRRHGEISEMPGSRPSADAVYKRTHIERRNNLQVPGDIQRPYSAVPYVQETIPFVQSRSPNHVAIDGNTTADRSKLRWRNCSVPKNLPLASSNCEYSRGNPQIFFLTPRITEAPSGTQSSISKNPCPQINRAQSPFRCTEQPGGKEIAASSSDNGIFPALPQRWRPTNHLIPLGKPAYSYGPSIPMKHPLPSKPSKSVMGTHVGDHMRGGASPAAFPIASRLKVPTSIIGRTPAKSALKIRPIREIESSPKSLSDIKPTEATGPLWKLPVSKRSTESIVTESQRAHNETPAVIKAHRHPTKETVSMVLSPAVFKSRKLPLHDADDNLGTPLKRTSVSAEGKQNSSSANDVVRHPAHALKKEFPKSKNVRYTPMRNCVRRWSSNVIVEQPVVQRATSLRVIRDIVDTIADSLSTVSLPVLARFKSSYTGSDNGAKSSPEPLLPSKDTVDSSVKPTGNDCQKAVNVAKNEKSYGKPDDNYRADKEETNKVLDTPTSARKNEGTRNEAKPGDMYYTEKDFTATTMDCRKDKNESLHFPAYKQLPSKQEPASDQTIQGETVHADMTARNMFPSCDSYPSMDSSSPPLEIFTSKHIDPWQKEEIENSKLKQIVMSPGSLLPGIEEETDFEKEKAPTSCFPTSWNQNKKASSADWLPTTPVQQMPLVQKTSPKHEDFLLTQSVEQEPCPPKESDENEPAAVPASGVPKEYTSGIDNKETVDNSLFSPQLSFDQSLLLQMSRGRDSKHGQAVSADRSTATTQMAPVRLPCTSPANATPAVYPQTPAINSKVLPMRVVPHLERVFEPQQSPKPTEQSVPHRVEPSVSFATKTAVAELRPPQATANSSTDCKHFTKPSFIMYERKGSEETPPQTTPPVPPSEPASWTVGFTSPAFGRRHSSNSSDNQSTSCGHEEPFPSSPPHVEKEKFALRGESDSEEGSDIEPSHKGKTPPLSHSSINQKILTSASERPGSSLCNLTVTVNNVAKGGKTTRPKDSVKTAADLTDHGKATEGRNDESLGLLRITEMCLSLLHRDQDLREKIYGQQLGNRHQTETAISGAEKPDLQQVAATSPETLPVLSGIAPLVTLCRPGLKPNEELLAEPAEPAVKRIVKPTKMEPAEACAAKPAAEPVVKVIVQPSMNVVVEPVTKADAKPATENKAAVKLTPARPASRCKSSNCATAANIGIAARKSRMMESVMILSKQIKDQRRLNQNNPRNHQSRKKSKPPQM